ncbi:oligoendopeptidase F [Spiroplasma syrphidicola EA-1]|uniref:Oligopeptidase F n=1 Tax=Spiroplasma syrphidicola EA-1 TaxID=1276229 RepID=R4UEW1_9MOLU|nr:oligoendopeptidase F [Spiroplasma syrphidicola]AGM26469.1 oligoendopeptidase F [Spiroplasma syrphidicola EA-1]
MKRSEVANEYKWDFSHLYQDVQAWKADLTIIVKKLEEIITFQGKLNDQKIFKKYLLLDEEIDLIASKLGQYLHMGDIDTTNLEYQELSGIYSNTINQIASKLAFVAPEIKAVGEETVMNWVKNDPDISQYEYGYRKFFRSSKHILSARDEEILSIVARSRGAADDLYDLLAYADRKPVYITHKGQEAELTNALYSEIMEKSDPLKDQGLRIKVSELFTKNLVEKKHSLARVYEAIIHEAVEDVQLRGYKNTLQAALSSDDVDEEIYASLIKYGKKHSNLFVRYELLLKNYFKFEKFYATDRSLKLVKNVASLDKKYTVEEAKDLIRTALTPLGDEYLTQLEKAWSNNRIDYYEDTNKRDGAYSSGGAGVEPIILMNWDGTISSVNTLAHEVGHSVHTLLADSNNRYPLGNYPIILAEVASTVNEHLLFDYLYSIATTNDEKIYLLQNRIEEIMGTFFRQIHFADFEWTAHQKVENNEPLDADKLADLFAQKSEEFGYDVFDKLDEKGKPYGWTRILHFFNSPYYVYKYATCIVASFKLYNDVLNHHSEQLINFLKQGGNKEPLLILKDIGIDYTDQRVYDPLIEKLTALIDELELLLKNK